MAQHRFLIILAGPGMLGACCDAKERSDGADNDNGATLSVSSGDGNSMISADGGSGKDGEPFSIELTEGGRGTKGSIHFSKVATDDSVD